MHPRAIALWSVLVLPAVPSLSLAGAPAQKSSARVEKFGAPVAAAAAAVPIAKVVAEPDAYAGKKVVVDGKVRAACTRRGCWMELAATVDKGTPGCRVTFKDYGFFVPTDSAGADVRVQGEVAVRVIARAEVEHLESEGASFGKKDPDGSAREVRIVATGVEMRRK